MSSEICVRRTAYFDWIPEQRALNGLPESGPLPHVYGSRTRVAGGEWSTPKCSWCGKTLDSREIMEATKKGNHHP